MNHKMSKGKPFLHEGRSDSQDPQSSESEKGNRVTSGLRTRETEEPCMYLPSYSHLQENQRKQQADLVRVALQLHRGSTGR